MRRAVPFGAGLTAASALLGFVLLFADRMADPDRLIFSGWQVTLTQWALLGLALVAGLGSGGWALLRLRRLPGEGLVLGSPAVLAGLLLSGLPVWGAEHATTWAQLQTTEHRQVEREARLELAGLDKHPPVVPSGSPAATPALAALLPGAADLGPAWYPVQDPPAIVTKDRTSVDGARSMLVRSSRTAGHQWDVQRLLAVSVRRYPEDGQAASATAMAMSSREGPWHRSLVRGAAVVSYHYRGAGADRFVAVMRKGPFVWVLRLSAQPQAAPLAPPETQQVLALLVAKVPE